MPKKLAKFDAVAKKVRRVAMKVRRVATKVVRLPHEIDCRQRDKIQATTVAFFGNKGNTQKYRCGRELQGKACGKQWEKSFFHFSI